MADLHFYMNNWNYKRARDLELDDTIPDPKFLSHVDDCFSSSQHLVRVRGNGEGGAEAGDTAALPR